MKISPISPTQYTASLDLITAAFATAPHHDGTEAALVAKLRQSADYQPAYDVVATADDGRLLGHAMLSLATIVGATRWPVLVLAPLAVLPAAQGQGIGRTLVQYLEMQAGEDERRAISVLGEPAYYGRLGYRPASEYNVTGPFSGPEFMLKPIREGGLIHVQGQLVYDQAFGL